MQKTKQIDELNERIHQNAVAHGWWPDDVMTRDLKEILVLIIGEVSELHEAYRRNKLDELCDKGIPLTNFQEETADIVIRVLDLLYAYGVVPEEVELFDGDAPESFGAKCFDLMQSAILMFDGEGLDFCEDSPLRVAGLEVLSTVWTMCAERGVDLWGCVEVKHAYNVTRPFRHGDLLA
jgi:NTP pyrophosphatase (non-canonical NTP hydrolase)